MELLVKPWYNFFFLLCRLTQWRTGVWAFHFKSAGAAAQPSGSSQPGRREEQAIAVRTSP